VQGREPERRGHPHRKNQPNPEAPGSFRAMGEVQCHIQTNPCHDSNKKCSAEAMGKPFVWQDCILLHQAHLLSLSPPKLLLPLGEHWRSPLAQLPLDLPLPTLLLPS